MMEKVDRDIAAMETQICALQKGKELLYMYMCVVDVYYVKESLHIEKACIGTYALDDIFNTLGQACYFSTLDLASGYWQIEMDPATNDKSAFTTRAGLFEFEHMPFGLCNAPATFQRLMQAVLAGMEWGFCFVYLDDILVCSRIFEEHLDNLQQIFDRLRKAGLTVKPKSAHLYRMK